MSSEADQNHHPIGIYLKVWTLLFVLSIASYMVDYYDFQGLLRWTLLAPPLALLFLIGFMISEGYYVFDARVDYFGQPEAATRIHVSDVLGTKH